MNGKRCKSKKMLSKSNTKSLSLSLSLSRAVVKCVEILSKEYNFEVEDGLRLVGGVGVGVGEKEVVKRLRASFPLPYNGEVNDSCCNALRQNNGLYTQCTVLRKGENKYCNGCRSVMEKSGAEVPEYGTIEQRKSMDIFEYTDPKGRKPIAYTKVMKKYKISEEQVLEEAAKVNIIINPRHFVVSDTEGTKRGRPKTIKEVKTKGVKGRPKKENKVVIVEGQEEDDLFAALVANSLSLEDVVKSPEADGKSPEADGKTPESDGKSPESDGKSPESDGKSTPSVGKKSSKSEEEREAERLIKLQEKESKRIAAEVAKKEKEEKLAIEKAEKAKEREAERLAREEKKKAEELAKLQEKEAKLQEKEAKKAAKTMEREAKQQKKTSKQAPVQPQAVCKDEEEPDVVKKIEFDGKKYLKSKKTGIIYDYNEYVQNGEQIVVGQWNDTTNKIVFTAFAEEEEEEDDYE